MKKTLTKAVLWAVLSATLGMGQLTAQSFKAGKSADVLGNFKSFGKTAGTTIQVSSSEALSLEVNVSKSENGTDTYVGAIQNEKNGTFYLTGDAASLKGTFILKDKKKAFSLTTDANGNANIAPADVNKLLCIDYTGASKALFTSGARLAATSTLTNLQSNPGAGAVMLLDFDGQYVSGTYWNSGNPINAAPSGFDDATVQEVWELVSEDYRPFAVNITTSEAVYNATPANRRMRCIFTPTNTAAPGAGGVAYVGSFSWGNETPCWVFNGGVKGAGEAASHELGHTVGLSHDGLSNPVQGYYGGHGNWGPIMGASYGPGIVQFSKGEYQYANNQEDDISIITSNNGFTFRNDDYGNDIGSASALGADGSGNVNKNGVIEKASDYDVFSFTTSGGVLNLNFNPAARHGDLDISVTLRNASNGVVASSDNGGLGANLSNVNLGSGTYYIFVNGAGEGNPVTDGYSNYASEGFYSISGNVPPMVNVSGTAILYGDCNFSGPAGGFNVGSYTLAQLQSKGIGSNALSSLKVANGYEVVLFDADNFGGNSVVINSNYACLVDNGWNDRTNSMIVRNTGITTLGGTYYLQNRNSNLFMDISAISTADGAGVVQWNFTGAGNQQYAFTHLGGGVYKIIAQHSGKSIDVEGLSTANGARIAQYSYNGGANQQFLVQATGDGFYKLVAQNSGKLVEVGGFSTAAGGTVQQWQDAGQLSGQWKLVPVVNTFSTLIQAENYSAMSGVQTEATSDAGGGLNVGWINTGSWMAYNNITIPTTGSYLVEYRVASVPGGQLSLDLNGGSVVLGAVNVPATGGWQTWTTVSQTVNINAGTYNFGIFAKVGGWNINWFKISKAANIPAFSSSIVTGVSEATNISGFEVFPNPASANLFVHVSEAFSGADLSVIDMMGQQVHTGVLGSGGIEISGLPNGVYTLLLSKDGAQLSKRFVKQ